METKILKLAKHDFDFMLAEEVHFQSQNDIQQTFADSFSDLVQMQLQCHYKTMDLKHLGDIWSYHMLVCFIFPRDRKKTKAGISG